MSKGCGGVILALGALILGYFWLIFSIFVPAPGMSNLGPGFVPNQVVNEGLMNDRLVGTMIGMGLLLGGLFVLVSGKDELVTPKRVPVPPPQTPPGFTFNLLFAIHYKAQPVGQPALSRPIWNREVGRIVNLATYRSQQIEWAYLSNVAPHDFARFVSFIEAYRVWQFSGGKSI